MDFQPGNLLCWLERPGSVKTGRSRSCNKRFADERRHEHSGTTSVLQKIDAPFYAKSGASR
jgi:hypothetical protein